MVRNTDLLSRDFGLFCISGTFGEVGAKYKNKYRSLTYNIKDPKNDGLFRRILLRDLSPIAVRTK